MKNPIPTTGFVATPDSLGDLMEYCERFSGQEKAIAMLVATMTLNLAHKMFNEATQTDLAQLVSYPTDTINGTQA